LSSTQSRNTLAEHEAVLERLLGPPPTGAEAERRHRHAVASRDGGICAACGRTLDHGEPVWMARLYCGIGWSATFSGTREVWWRLPVGAECVPHAVGPFESADTGGPSPFRSSAERCAGCARPIYYPEEPFRLFPSPFDRRWAHCSQRCAWTARNRVRSELRAEARRRDCAVCGERFQPARSDAVTCSSACRQRAYRRRRQQEQAP
jgi:hypothetical protein